MFLPRSDVLANGMESAWLGDLVVRWSHHLWELLIFSIEALCSRDIIGQHYTLYLTNFTCYHQVF